MIEQNCANCKYSEPTCGALCCMGQKYAPYVRPTDSCADWKSAKQTHYDSIRDMSIERMALFLADMCDGANEEWWLAWLKQEVPDADTR